MLSFVIKMSYLEMCLMVEPFRLPLPFSYFGALRRARLFKLREQRGAGPHRIDRGMDALARCASRNRSQVHRRGPFPLEAAVPGVWGINATRLTLGNELDSNGACSTVPSFRTMCTWLPPASINAIPFV